VLVRSQGTTASAPDLREWFTAYNGRQTIEAGIKQEKRVFKLQHMMSQQAVEMQVQLALTLFAANFVQWALEWARGQVIVAPPGVAAALQCPKYVVRVAANSAAHVEVAGAQVVVRFSELSGLAGVVVRVAGPTPVQLALPLYPPAHF
jgi:hypothetical protein